MSAASTTQTALACLCSSTHALPFLVVERPFFPSAGDRTERKKFATCPPDGTFLTGEQRVQKLKAKMVGNCCNGQEPCAYSS